LLRPRHCGGEVSQLAARIAPADSMRSIRQAIVRSRTIMAPL
jgi:hypothetical protein